MYTVPNNHTTNHIGTDHVLLALARTLEHVEENPQLASFLNTNNTKAVEMSKSFDGPAYYKAYRVLETLGLVKKQTVLRWATWANSHGLKTDGEMTADEYWDNVMDKSMALDLWKTPQAREYGLTPSQCLRIIQEENPSSVFEAMTGRLAGMFAFDNGANIDF